jgi:DnaJ like chaperone protein
MNDALTRRLRALWSWYKARVRKGFLDGDESEQPAPVTVSRTDPPLLSDTGIDDAFRQLAFTFAVIALGAKLAAADGAVKQEEFTAFCVLFPMPSEEQPKIQRLFFMAHNDPNSFVHYAKQIAGLFPSRSKLREELIRRLCRLAESDGRATLSEKRMLEGIAEVLKVESRVIYESLAVSLSSSHQRDHYALLGVTASVSNDGLKQAYRSRVRELHPDRLMAEGYASEDIAHAEAELMAVNESYLILARKRKIK